MQELAEPFGTGGFDLHLSITSVELVRGVLGGAFQVMRRLRGRVMLDAIFGPGVLRMPTVLATLHAQLHGLDVPAFTVAKSAPIGGQRPVEGGLSLSD